MEERRKANRANYTLEEWTERKRKLERGYDAKRRARKRDEDKSTLAQRRMMRETQIKKANPPSSEFALNTVVMALQALTLPSPDEAGVAVLEDCLRKRLAVLRETVAQ